MDMQVDYLIIGAGPAGLQLGYYLERNGRDYLILEQSNAPGRSLGHIPGIGNSFLSTRCIPEMKTWRPISDGIGTRCSVMTLSCCSKTTVNSISRMPATCATISMILLSASTFGFSTTRPSPTFLKWINTFAVTDADGEVYYGKRLIIATGLSKPNIPDIPGAELCDTYASHSTDPADYTNQRVLIVGKGNSAFETANNLTETAAVIHMCSPESVTMAWQTHYVGNLRAVNNNFLDTYQLKSQNAVIDAEIERWSAAMAAWLCTWPTATPWARPRCANTIA